MAHRYRYSHLTGSSAYYPFGARTALRRRQRFHVLFLRLLSAVLIIAAIVLAARQYLFHGGQPSAPSEMAVATPQGSDTSTVQVTVGEAAILPRYQALYAQNRDMIGWLQIPGTNIDYPVMQTPQDNEHYLHLGFDGLYSVSGSLFVDAACKLGNAPTANWLVYGHNMGDGSMFGTLTNYASPEFYAQHPTFTFDTLYKKQTFRVVAAFYTTVGADAQPYYKFFDAENRDEWLTAYNGMIGKALYDTGTTASYGDQLLTLSTCGTSALLTDERFAVLAVRVEES